MALYEQIRNIGQYPNIAKKLDSAERLMDSDPDMAVAAMRTAGELMLKKLCLKHFGEEGTDNSTRINDLRKKGIIGSSISSGLHKIRLTANDSLHEGYEVEDYDVRLWYGSILELAKIFVEETDPESAVNRGIKFAPGRAIVPEQENVTEGLGLSREERLVRLRETAVRLRQFLEESEVRCRRYNNRSEDEYGIVDYRWEEAARFTIPVEVQEYFIEYDAGKRLGPTGDIIDWRTWDRERLEVRRPAIKEFILEASQLSSSITLPESYVWDYIKVRREVEDSADDYLADETIGIVFMSDPAWLLNEASVGGDQNRRHGMYLTYQVKELTLPDFKNYDGSSIFTFPRDLPLMMVYFPMLEKVTLHGETFSTDELLKDKTAARWIKAGHVQFGRLSSLGGGLIPDSGIKPSVNIPAIPERMFRPSLKGPDTKILNQADFYSLFTLARKFDPGYPNPGLPLDPNDSAVREYINSINGDPIRLEQITASEGFDQDASYMISSFRMNGDIRTDVRICLDPQVPFRKDHRKVLSLPEWVCDGALRFGTTSYQFLYAVSKVRPELFDSYKPENHNAAAEPLPPAEPAAGLSAPAARPEDFPNPPAINFCPYCGARVKGYKFCVKCGRKLIK